MTTGTLSLTQAQERLAKLQADSRQRRQESGQEPPEQPKNWHVQNTLTAVAQRQRNLNGKPMRSLAEIGEELAGKSRPTPNEFKPQVSYPTSDELRAEANIHPWPEGYDLVSDDNLRRQCETILEKTKSWAKGVKETRHGYALILSGEVGCGKTTLAKAASTSMAYVSIARGDKPARVYYPYAGTTDKNYVVVKGSVMLLGWQVMTLVNDDEFNVQRLGIPAVKMVVLDDVGREGEIKYSKKDGESQKSVVQNLYFRFINAIYAWNDLNPEKKVSLLLTSNLTLDQMRNDFFNDATWSRIKQMAPTGHKLQFPRIGDIREIIEAQGGIL